MRQKQVKISLPVRDMEWLESHKNQSAVIRAAIISFRRKTMSLPYTPEFRFVTGPLEGCLADSGGLWMEYHDVESYAGADDDMRSRFEDWCEQECQEPNEETWQAWLNSWQDEPIEEGE